MQQLAVQPFPEVRLSALNLLKVLAAQPWGQRLLHAQPAFLEYLLDRSTEHDKEGKQAKFEVVEALVNSPTGTDILGRENMVKLRAYHMEGPFYVRVESAVAYEGE